MSYTLEIFSSAPFADEKETLRSTEAQIVSKRSELLKFESEYHEVFGQFTEMASKCAGEVQEVRIYHPFFFNFLDYFKRASN